MNFMQYLNKKRCSLFFIKIVKYSYVSLLLITTFSSASTYESSSPLFIEYIQHSTNNIEVSYRNTPNMEEPVAKLKINEELVINNENNISYPKNGDITAVLFLVDISDPARQQIVKKNINQIINILESAKSHHKFGLASFSENLNILSPIGSDKDKIIEKARELKAIGSETLLYQYVAKSVDLLNAYDARRRVLFIFSDGKAEDQRDVYNHKYVTEKTNEKNVIINGLAFPPKPKRVNITHYQTLERLALDTGGIFLKASSTGDIDNIDITQLLSFSDVGGYWNFNIEPLKETALAGNISAILNITLGQVSTSLPITIELSEKDDLSQIKKLLAIGFPALLLLSLLIFLLTKKKKEQEITYAFIDTLDGNDRYNINKKTYKIGRNNENDLVLVNNSVSSFHAQIHINRDNEFIITDLQSTNGVIVNDEEITSYILDDKDTIEIGEVRLRFLME
jgi:hypothetical protein